MAISSYWQNHINAWQNSRLSQAAYCRQHNLKYGTFTNRLSIFRAKQIVTPASELVAVRIQPPLVAAGCIVLQIRTHRLELPVSVSARWLAELLQCLG